MLSWIRDVDWAEYRRAMELVMPAAAVIAALGWMIGGAVADIMEPLPSHQRTPSVGVEVGIGPAVEAGVGVDEPHGAAAPDAVAPDPVPARQPVGWWPSQQQTPPQGRPVEMAEPTTTAAAPSAPPTAVPEDTPTPGPSPTGEGPEGGPEPPVSPTLAGPLED